MNFLILSPEIALSALAILIIVIDLFLPQRAKPALGYLAVLGLIVPAALVINLNGQPGVSFSGTLVADSLSTFFQLLVLLCSALVILSSVDYAPRHTRYVGEFYAMILFASVGGLLLSSGRELVTLYIGMELTSIPQFILAGFIKGDEKSGEAGLKYLLLGALSSAALLYGMALMYGATGTTELTGIAAGLRAPSSLAVTAMVLMVAGFGFKTAIVPFQMWIPDVYQGAPTPVTAFLSVASKAAGFAVLIRVFDTALVPLQAFWPTVFAVLAALTMTIGNLAALRQTDAKRLMGYSSIGQAGYILMGLAAVNARITAGLLFFMITYVITNIGAFIAITYFSNRLGSDDLKDYDGLGQRSPAMALALTVCLLSLVGMPPMAGFWGKVFLFLSVFDSGPVWLVLVGLLNSAIAAYYYLKVVHAMYLRPASDDKPLGFDPSLSLALLAAVVGIFVVGIVPRIFMDAATNAAGALFR